MVLNKVKEWITRIVEREFEGIDLNVFVGKHVRTDESESRYLISVRSGGGGIRPPFIRYERINVLIISPNKILQNDIPSNGGGLNLFPDKNKTPPVAPPVINESSEITWNLAGEIADAIVKFAESSSFKEEDCLDGLSLQPLSTIMGPYLTDEINGRIYFETTLQIII